MNIEQQYDVLSVRAPFPIEISYKSEIAWAGSRFSMPSPARQPASQPGVVRSRSRSLHGAGKRCVPIVK